MDSNFPDDSLKSCNSLLNEIEQYLKKDPDNKKWQYELSKCHFWIGSINYTKGNFSVALNAFSHSLKILDSLVKTDIGNKDWREKLADCNDKIGDIYKEQKNISAALYYYSSSLKIKESTSKMDIINAFLDRLHNGLYEYAGSNREVGDNPANS